MENMENKNIVTYNIREERLKLKEKKVKKSCIDEIKENAKKHFEEIFNRL